MSTYTKGPWTASRDYGHGFEIRPAHPTVGFSFGYAPIAVVRGDKRLHPPAVLEANARLMAASPELLAYAECEQARASSEDIAETVLRKHGWNPHDFSAIEFMDIMREAAIAKALGARHG